MERPNVILAVDMIKGFLEPNHPLYCGDDARRIIPHVVNLLENQRDNHIFYVCDTHSEEDYEFKMFPPHCIIGTDESALIKEIEPFPGIIIRKGSFSAFFKTDMEERLKAIKPSLVTLVGVCTDICVLYAAVDLRLRHYEVQVPASCVASFDPKGHEWALNHMEKVLGVKVLRG